MTLRELIISRGLKVPQKKDSPKGIDCVCLSYYHGGCCCGANWADNDTYNKAIEEFDKILDTEII